MDLDIDNAPQRKPYSDSSRLDLNVRVAKQDTFTAGDMSCLKLSGFNPLVLKIT